MPILPAEVGVYPEGLLEQPPEACAPGRVWWVLHTRPRQEKSLARQLLEARVSFYLPLIPRRLLLRGRRLTSHVPLFAGYVFLHADRDERIQALATRRVVRSLEVGDQEALWRDLRQVHRLLATGVPITPEDRLAPGVLVEVRSGPLAGLRGKVLRTASGRRFLVQVDFIQRGASVLMDDWNLEVLDESEGRL
jgi:transcriptional antiterminator RfaH